MSATGSIYNLQSAQSRWRSLRPGAIALLLTVSLSACASAPRISVNNGVTTSRFTASELIARIKTALLNDEVVGRRRIDVHVIDADVTLTGRVASADGRDPPIQITRGVEGVRSVRSELQIQP